MAKEGHNTLTINKETDLLLKKMVDNKVGPSKKAIAEKATREYARKILGAEWCKEVLTHG